MTYKLASCIRRMVEHLSGTWEKDPFVCAIVNEFGGKDNWECHLFPREYVGKYDSELWAIALGIQKAGCGIILHQSYYNIGTKEPDYINTICLA